MSAFLHRKIDTFFTRLDVDKDGAITAKDFEILAHVVAETEKLDEKRAAQLKAQLLEVFEKLLKKISTSKDVFRESIIKMIKNKEFDKWAEGVYKAFFAAVDANGDGVIQKDEFILIFTALFQDAAMAEVAFVAYDTNHDGILSLAEYTAAGKLVLTTEDESCKSKLFWGPLL